MSKQLHIRGVRRKQVDEDKLALAFLLLAKLIHEQQAAESGETRDAGDQEAA